MTMTREMPHEMPMTGEGGLVARYESALRLADRIPLSLVQLAARVSVAHVFWQSAQSKLASWPVTLQLFAMEYRMPVLDPAVAAPLATAAEITGSVLLFFGLFSRLGALMLLGVVATIQIFVLSRKLGRAPALGFAAAADLCARRRRHIARLCRSPPVRSPGLTMLQQPINEAGVTPLRAGSPQAGTAPVRRPHVVILGAGFGGPQCCDRIAQGAGRRNGHRPAQLSSVPAAALPGGDGRPVAGADRHADPPHPGASEERDRADGKGRGSRSRSADRDDNQPAHSLRLSWWSRPARATPISAMTNGKRQLPA